VNVAHHFFSWHFVGGYIFSSFISTRSIWIFILSHAQIKEYVLITETKYTKDLTSSLRVKLQLHCILKFLHKKFIPFLWCFETGSYSGFETISWFGISLTNTNHVTVVHYGLLAFVVMCINYIKVNCLLYENIQCKT